MKISKNQLKEIVANIMRENREEEEGAMANDNGLVKFSYSGGYAGALEAAGAKVHAFKEFGDYQGTWYAKVTDQGKTGWITGGFGSCSGCDNYQATFEEYAWKHDNKIPLQKLVEFGRSYLTSITSQEEMEQQIEEEWSNYSYDEDLKEALMWVQENR